MPDFRFEGSTIAGRPVRGIITADSLSEAKSRINNLAKKKNVRIDQIKKRKTFMYKVQRGNESAVKGEQKAFSKEEVELALTNLGYKILSIQPKLLDFRLKPPPADIVTFVRVSADMLREQLSFNEVLQLMVEDVQNPTLRECVKEIHQDLRQGKDSEEAFIKQEKYLGRFTARMLGLASKSGNMVDIYESTAKFLERNAEFKRNLRSALIMPAFTVVAMLGAVMFYVAYIFPETARLFLKLGMDLPPMTAVTLQISDWLLGNIWLILFAIVAVVGAGAVFLSSARGKFLRDKYIIRLPVMGSLIHKTTIEIFCRVFHALYSGSGENIDAIRLSAEACGNKYFEHQIKTVAIPLMLNEGKGLIEGFTETGLFTKTALSRFRAGAETGTVKNSAQQIANFYEKETVYKLKNAVEFVQLFIAMFIMVVITALTLVSSETAIMKPKSPSM